MHDDVVLVTGASRGIGAATARLLAGEGRFVVVNYARNGEAAEALVAGIRASGGAAEAVQGDVAREADVLRIFEAVDRCGRLAGLVNNAGVVDRKARLDEMSAERLERMFRINVIGTMLCAREAVRRMSTRHGGRGGAIVNLSSAASVLGSPDLFVDYAASKGAVDTFTVGLAKEVAAEGIVVTSVRPGVIETTIHADAGVAERVVTLVDIIPARRTAPPEEVAKAIAFLLSDGASYCHGAILDVSGGRSAVP